MFPSTVEKILQCSFSLLIVQPYHFLGMQMVRVLVIFVKKMMSSINEGHREKVGVNDFKSTSLVTPFLNSLE